MLTKGKLSGSIMELSSAVLVNLHVVSDSREHSGGSPAPPPSVPDRFHFWGKKTMPQRLSMSLPESYMSAVSTSRVIPCSTLSYTTPPTMSVSHSESVYLAGNKFRQSISKSRYPSPGSSRGMAMP